MMAVLVVTLGVPSGRADDAKTTSQELRETHPLTVAAQRAVGAFP